MFIGGIQEKSDWLYNSTTQQKAFLVLHKQDVIGLVSSEDLDKLHQRIERVEEILARRVPLPAYPPTLA